MLLLFDVADAKMDQLTCCCAVRSLLLCGAVGQRDGVVNFVAASTGVARRCCCCLLMPMLSSSVLSLL
jgi:hypothetical protein